MKRNGLFTNEDDEWVSVSCVNILIDGKDEEMFSCVVIEDLLGL